MTGLHLGKQPPHRVLGLNPDENDPVLIVRTAQIRLMWWRRQRALAKDDLPLRLRAIKTAREAMLRRCAGLD